MNLDRKVGRGLAVALLAAFALSACGEGREPTGADAPPPATSDPGPVHVHGLGENPKDGALFVATHTGLFRIERRGGDANRVGGRYQDTMGFTVSGPDRFLGSGHPDGREGLPPFLGLIESSDAGETWTPRSLEGKADFHVLESADDVVYGYGADWDTREPQFLVSRDRGRTWSKRAEPEPLVSLAIDPADPARVVAAGERGLHASSAAGDGWRPVDGPTGLLSWPTPDRLYSVDERGVVRASDNGGQTWRVAGDAEGEPAAFEATGRDELYVALHDGEIKRSTNGGRTWRVFWSP